MEEETKCFLQVMEKKNITTIMNKKQTPLKHIYDLEILLLLCKRKCDVRGEANPSCDALYQVQQALNNIMSDYTMLVVAHRLSTVERAHNIIVIDKGHVAEQGSHAQLMAAGGLYSKLVQKQLLGVETKAEPSYLLEQSRPRRRQQRERWTSVGSGSGSDTEMNMRY